MQRQPVPDPRADQQGKPASPRARASFEDGRPTRRLVNQQMLLPLVQALALPLYWLIGRKLLGIAPPGAAIFTLLAPFGMHSAVLGLGFVVSYLNQHERRGYRHSRQRDWLIAYLREAWVSIRQFYWLMPLRAGFRTPEPVPPVQGLPIILIHGYGCNRGLWLPAARWFARRGYRVSAIDLLPMHCPIDDYAEPIAREVARVRAETGASRVALVAHSMGGLAARAYLRSCEEQGKDSWLAALVTLGTPHRGTHIARIGLGANAHQMRYGAAWLERLGPRQAVRATDDVQAMPRVTTLCSLQDNIVSRPFEQRLRGARAIVVRRQGHMSLATSTRVFRVVDRILRPRR
jgi:pimeloyl-ACP methyl ester carboxylesterase